MQVRIKIGTNGHGYFRQHMTVYCICVPSGDALGDEDDVEDSQRRESEAGAVDGVVAPVLVELSPDKVHERQDGLPEAGEHRYHGRPLPSFIKSFIDHLSTPDVLDSLVLLEDGRHCIAIMEAFTFKPFSFCASPSVLPENLSPLFLSYLAVVTSPTYPFIAMTSRV